MASVHAALGITPDNDREWVSHNRAMGPFLDSVFKLLRRFASLSLKECLLCTSLVSRVLTYPSRPLFQLVAHLALETGKLLCEEREDRESARESERERQERERERQERQELVIFTHHIHNRSCDDIGRVRTASQFAADVARRFNGGDGEGVYDTVGSARL